MTSSLPDWTLYRSFLEVVRDGSLSGAARRLNLTQPTLGRHIAALEMQLGLALFTRSARGLLPTAEALELIPHAEAMAAAAAALARAASAEVGSERGTVRVTASDIMGCEVLPPILATFRERFPPIAIELALTNRNEDLLRGDADIAVRMARPTQEALIARRIGTTAIGLFAHQRYLARAGAPQNVAQLAGHSLIGFDLDDRWFRSVGGSFAAQANRDDFDFRSDSDLAQLAALRAGLGIGGAQVRIAMRTPTLIPVLGDTLRFEMEVWLAMHENLKATRRVRLLFDHLAAGLLEYCRNA
jgi:DNA-binding transcriptional LysR family regulator